LFSALCRRYGLEPYRYKRQRYTTVMVRVPPSFVDKTLWPEYQELRSALNEYLNQATERIIREEVYGDADEASERTG
jgi:tRNA nucleotidyltransferase (CCA-adding enzyme)